MLQKTLRSLINKLFFVYLSRISFVLLLRITSSHVTAHAFAVVRKILRRNTIVLANEYCLMKNIAQNIYPHIRQRTNKREMTVITITK